MQLIRFGLVGTGAIAQSYLTAFRHTKRARLLAVTDIDINRAHAAAVPDSLAAYCDCQTMLSEQALDAVIICTPPSTHGALSELFLSRGIHVLCEKPIAIDSKTLGQMFACAKDNRVTLTMASKFRYVEDIIRAKKLLSTGLLGEVVFCENVFTSKVDMSQRWNSQASISGGGVLIDNGTHSVDILRYLLGPIAEIFVVEGARLQGLPVEETAHALVRGKNVPLGRIDLSWSMKTDQDWFIAVRGSQGELKIGWRESTYHLFASNEPVIIGTGYNKVDAFNAQLENFCATLQGEAESLITEADIRASVAVIEAGCRSLKSGQWEAVSPLFPLKSGAMHPENSVFPKDSEGAPTSSTAEFSPFVAI